MAQLDLYIQIGDEQVTGGDTSFKPLTDYPFVLGGRAAGFALMMEEFGRLEPSDATGIGGGTYDPYWDGTTFAATSTGTPTTTTIQGTGVTWSTNEFAGREVEITSGTQVGQKRVITSNTSNTLTFSPALAIAPVAGDTFTVKGGWVKFYHANTTSLSGVPVDASQRNARGDCWFGINAITPTALLMNRLVKTYGYTGSGFRFLKFANDQTTSAWQTGSTGGDLLAVQLQLAKEAEAVAGNTLRVKALILDSVTRDLFGVNLAYESDLQRTIDSLRNRLDVLGLVEAANTYTASASTTTTITIAGGGWTVNQWKGRTVRIDAGAMAGQLRLIASNTADTLTLFTNTTGAQNYAALASPPGTVAFSILAAPLFVIGNPHPGVAASIATVLAPGARFAHQILAARTASVRLFDWSFAGFAIPGELLPAVAADRYYDTPSYVAAGILLNNVITSFYTVQPTAAPGAAIPCVFMCGTSQFVTAGVQSALLTFMEQESLIGESPLTATPGVWIWNNATESVEPLDVATNSATLGSFQPGLFGPEVTLGRALVRDQFPNGVVIFKYAKSGVALTLEAGAANAAKYVEPGGEGDWDTIAVQFGKFKAAAMRDLNRSVDVIAIANDLSENDLTTDTAVAAFKAKAPLHIDRQRELCQTRVNDDVIPVVWMQPPPPASEVAGGSSLNPPSLRSDVRTWIAEELPDLREGVHVILNEGRRRYELQRADAVHYGGEAVLNIGEDIAAKILEVFSTEGGSESESTPAGAAAFIVETGSGATDANSYASVSFADSYHQAYGDPSTWRNATTAARENALREATRAADEIYGNRWSGTRATATQALDWPRADVPDQAGDFLESDVIPLALQKWTARAALLILTGSVLSPVEEDGSAIASESLSAAGGFSKSVTYIGGKSQSQSFPALDRMLTAAGLVSGASGWGWLA
jgi:hypothetical protein